MPAALGVAFVGASLWIAGPALDGDFLPDDFLYIVYNPYVQALSLENALEILDPWGVPPTQTRNYAPVHLFAHAIEWRLFGGEATRGWHVVNAVAHGLSALLVLALFRRSGVPGAAAVFGAAFFLVHPANVEVICWISQLKTLLALLLSIGALLLLERRPALATLLFALAVLAKFTAVAIVPAAAAQTWVRSRDAAAPTAWRWIAVWGGLVLLISVPQLVAFEGQAIGRSAIEADPLVHARSIVAIAMRYLVMALTGSGVSAFHEPEPAASLLDPWWLAGLLALALLGARTLVTLRRRDEEAVYWVMAAAAFVPVSQVLPFTFPMGDRYLYPILPGLIGGALLAARPHAARLLDASAAHSERAARGLRTAAALGAAALIAALAVGSERRAPAFTTVRAMMLDASLHYPDGMQAALLRGERAASEGDAPAAARAYQHAVERGYVDLLALLTDPTLTRVRDAPEFQAVVRDVADRTVAYFDGREDLDTVELYHLALARWKSGEPAAAIRLLERALADAGPYEPQIRSLLDDVRRAHPTSPGKAPEPE